MSDPGAHPRDGEVAEYVLGTMPAHERAAFEREIASDASLRALVRVWEERLVPIADRVPPVQPSSGLWPAIVAATGELSRNVTNLGDAAAEIARLKRSRGAWRATTTIAGALAASFAIFIVSERYMPAQPPVGGLVAVVNRSGELPALLVRVDPRVGIVQVRALGAETPADRSLELWSIVSGETPRSLGIVAPGATRVSVRAQDRPRLDGATIAVTVEQAGGSPDGTPKGPVVYSGKLVPENP